MADISTILQDESVQARFWAKVDRRGDDECWPWTGATVTRDGRGLFGAKGVRATAPSVSLQIATGGMVEGKPFACHSCDNPNCVNPAHLWWGDRLDNARDSAAKGRVHGMRKTHCARGHEFSAENTQICISKRGHRLRKCRRCTQLFRLRREYSVRETNGRRSPELVAMLIEEFGPVGPWVTRTAIEGANNGRD